MFMYYDLLFISVVYIDLLCDCNCCLKLVSGIGVNF